MGMEEKDYVGSYIFCIKYLKYSKHTIIKIYKNTQSLIIILQILGTLYTQEILFEQFCFEQLSAL